VQRISAGLRVRVKVRVMIASVPQDTIVVSRARMQAILDGLDRADRGLAAASRLAREISDTFEDTSMIASPCCVVVRCSCGVAILRFCQAICRSCMVVKRDAALV
jgi:hypothetical protein